MRMTGSSAARHQSDTQEAVDNHQVDEVRERFAGLVRGRDPIVCVRGSANNSCSSAASSVVNAFNASRSVRKAGDSARHDIATGASDSTGPTTSAARLG